MGRAGIEPATLGLKVPRVSSVSILWRSGVIRSQRRRAGSQRDYVLDPPPDLCSSYFHRINALSNNVSDLSTRCIRKSVSTSAHAA